MDYQLVDMLAERLQYAHGQEELRPLSSRLNNRHSLEPIIRQPYLSPQSSNSSPINTFAVRNLRSASSVNAKATSNLYRASPSPSPSPDHTTVSARTSTYHSALSVPSSPSPSPSQPPNRSKVYARPSPNRSMVSELTTPYHSAVSVLPSPSPSPSQSPNHSMVSELTTPYHSAVSVLSSPSPNRSMVSALDGGKGLSTNWSPLDDGINASDPMSREDADHYIHMVLYGPTQSKRLPVFVDICSECNSLAHLSL